MTIHLAVSWWQVALAVAVAVAAVTLGCTAVSRFSRRRPRLVSARTPSHDPPADPDATRLRAERAVWVRELKAREDSAARDAIVRIDEATSAVSRAMTATGVQVATAGG